MPSHAFLESNPATGSNKRLRFSDSYNPSAIQLRLKLGPSESPSLILKISITFEPGKLPRIKVTTKRPRGRTYVEDSDDIPLDPADRSRRFGKGRWEAPRPQTPAARPDPSRRAEEVVPTWAPGAKSPSDRPVQEPKGSGQPPSRSLGGNERTSFGKIAGRKRPREGYGW